jgi:TolA-binding protein
MMNNEKIAISPIVGLVMLALSFGAGWFWSAGGSSDTIDRLISGNKQLGITIDQLRDELARTQEQIEGLTGIVSILEATNTQIESDYLRLAEIQGLDSESIRQAKKSLQRAKEIIRRIKELMGWTSAN